MANSRQGIQENNPRQGQKSNVSQKKGRSGDHQEKDMLDFMNLEKCQELMTNQFKTEFSNSSNIVLVKFKKNPTTYELRHVLWESISLYLRLLTRRHRVRPWAVLAGGYQAGSQLVPSKHRHNFH